MKSLRHHGKRIPLIVTFIALAWIDLSASVPAPTDLEEERSKNDQQEATIAELKAKIASLTTSLQNQAAE